MPTRIIIDGFNLFHRWGVTRELFLEEGDIGTIVSTAVSRLTPLLRRMPGTYTIVLDGGVQPSKSRQGGIGLIFAGPQKTADQVICEQLDAASRPQDIMVVTSDRSLGGSARAFRSHRISVEDFLKKLSAMPPEEDIIPEKYATPSAEEVAEYLTIFGNAEDVIDSTNREDI